MLVIGLTGGIGSGKSVTAQMFRDLGVTVIDADQLARDVVQTGSAALRQIAAHFGNHLLDSNGELKRPELREIVFADEQERLWLERLLHPLVAELMLQQIQSCASEYCIIESPLLLETQQHKLANRILVVDVSEKVQLQRALDRDGSNEATIRGIIAAQMPREERVRRADDMILNERDLKFLHAQVQNLHQQYLELNRKSA